MHLLANYFVELNQECKKERKKERKKEKTEGERGGEKIIFGSLSAIPLAKECFYVSTMKHFCS